jgi:TldD protein
MWNELPLDPKKVLQRALKNGGEFADLFVEDLDSTSLQFEAGRMDNVVAGVDRGAGLRIVANGRTIYAYTNDLTEAGLIELADQLAGAVRQGQSGHVGALKATPPGVRMAVKRDPTGAALQEKIDFVKRANAAAWQSDLIKQVRVVYRDRQRKLAIANSHGMQNAEVQKSLVFLTQVVASDGNVIQTGYEPIGGATGFEILDNDAPERIARIAADRALQNLKARPCPAGTMPVVLSAEAGGTMVHEAVGHGLEADLADQGMSVYAGKVGQKVASDLVTVIDDGTMPGMRGSFGYDDEGHASQRNVLIENGILKTYMYDKLMALRKGVESTGNGRRESYRHKPIVRMTNTYIASGISEPGLILSSVDKGLFVKKMGGGQVNTVNGDFVFEVTEGYLIENGKIGAPVRGATLTGNGPQTLQQIDMVGNDLGFSIGTCGKDGQGVPVTDAQPTLRIPEMVVGGSEG